MANREEHEGRAACLLQNAFRCHVSRTTYYELLGMSQLSPEEKELLRAAEEKENQKKSAMAIQCAFRCYLAKNVYFELLGQDGLPLEDGLPSGEEGQDRTESGRGGAAQTIQCAFRCYLAKNFYFELLGQDQLAQDDEGQTAPAVGQDSEQPENQDQKPLMEGENAHNLEELSMESSQPAGGTIQRRPRSGESHDAKHHNGEQLELQSQTPQLMEDENAQNLEDLSLESSQPAGGTIQRRPRSGAPLDAKQIHQAAQTIQCAYRSSRARNLYYELLGAGLAQQTMEENAKEDDATRETSPSGNDDATNAHASGVDDAAAAADVHAERPRPESSISSDNSAAASATMIQCAFRSYQARNVYYELLGAGIAQETMGANLEEDDAAAQEFNPSGHDERMQQLIREGMALLSNSPDFDTAVASQEMQALIEKARSLWAELGEDEATSQVLLLQGTMDEGEAAVLQQMVDMVVEQQPVDEGERPLGETQAVEECDTTSEVLADDRMQQLIREGMALLCAEPQDLDTVASSPEMQTLVDKATTLWAELGEDEATAQVLSLKGTMDEGDAAVRQKMVDLVVFGAPSVEEERERTTAGAAEDKGGDGGDAAEVDGAQESAAEADRQPDGVQQAPEQRAQEEEGGEGGTEKGSAETGQDEAATRIQAAARGRRDRQRAEKVRREAEAAARIQMAIRGRLARRLVILLRAELQGVEGEGAKMEEEGAQERFEGEAAKRSEVEELKRMLAEVERKQAEELAAKEEAERKRLEEEGSQQGKVATEQAGTSGKDEELEAKTGIDDEGAREDAAVRVQAVVRGHRGRILFNQVKGERIGIQEESSLESLGEELLTTSQEMMHRLPSGAKRELRRALASGDSELAQLIREVCSLTIQCALRGKFARTRMQKRIAEMEREDTLEDGQYQSAVEETAEWERVRSTREAEANQSEGEVELWDAGQRKYTEDIVGSAQADAGGLHSVRVEREISAEKPRLSNVHVVVKPRQSAWAARVEKERSESPPPLDRAARIREYSENHKKKKQAAAARREAEQRLQDGCSSPPGFQTHHFASNAYRYDSPHARRPDGQVVLRYENGDSYQGGWGSNRPEGYGTFVWAEGDRYVGQWKHGRRHGQGEYDWADGSKFTGWWAQGKQCGKGCFEWPDGKAYEGVWTPTPDDIVRQTREVKERRVYTAKPKMLSSSRGSSLESWTPQKGQEMLSSQTRARAASPSRARAASPSRPGTAASYASQAETASPAGSRPITAEGALRPGAKEERSAEFGKGGRAKKRVSTSLSSFSSTSTLGKIRHVRDPLERGGGRAKPGEGGETLFKLLIQDTDRMASQMSAEEMEWNFDSLETMYAYGHKAAFQRFPQPAFAPSSSSSVRRLYTVLSASNTVSDPLPLPHIYLMPGSPLGDPRPSIQGMMSDMQRSLSPIHHRTPPRSAPSAVPSPSSPSFKTSSPALKSPQIPVSKSPQIGSPSSPTLAPIRRKLTRTESVMMMEHMHHHEKIIEKAKDARSAVRELLDQEARAIKMGQRGDSELSMLFGKFSEGGESDVQYGVMDQRNFLDCLTHLGVVGGAKVDEHGVLQRTEGVVKKQDAIDLFNSCRRSSSRTVERHRLTINDFGIAMNKLNDILDGKCFQKLTPAALRQQSLASPTAARVSASAAASGSPEMKELHRVMERQRRGKTPLGWGADIVARNRKKNLFFENPFHDPLFEFEQVRSYM